MQEFLYNNYDEVAKHVICIQIDWQPDEMNLKILKWDIRFVPVSEFSVHLYPAAFAETYHHQRYKCY